MVCDDKSFSITHNLHQALQRIREDRAGTLLWVDAICINQSDDDEKTHQVKMMRDIYNHAELVLIWLGEEEPTDKLGFEMMHRMYKILGEPSISQGNQTDYIDFKALKIPHINDPSWDAAKMILARTWFNRIWVLQELLVARKAVFLCGRLEMESQILLLMVGNINKYSFLRTAMMVNSSSYMPIHMGST